MKRQHERATEGATYDDGILVLYFFTRNVRKEYKLCELVVATCLLYPSQENWASVQKTAFLPTL